MSTDYSEDRLIQKSAAELMETELGWTSIYAYDKEVLGENGTFGRNSFHEVLLTQRFRLALKKLNPWINDKQIAEAIERMTERMSSQTLMQINEQKYQFIRDGIPVTRIKPDGTSEEIKAVVIDFENIDNNDFLCVRELWIYGALYRRRADIVGFVNGIPLLFVELKNHNVEVENAFNENYLTIWTPYRSCSIIMPLSFSVTDWKPVSVPLIRNGNFSMSGNDLQNWIMET